MSKELHPICFYINDREEMLHQMFSTMKEEKFRAMLPPILKGMAVEELKKYCLEELLGMSAKRIHSIVAGLELVSSSDSEDAELAASENEDSPSEDDSDSDCPVKPRRSSREVRTDARSEEVGESSAVVARPEKTLLEMLELELRARAIRAALTHQEKINLLDNRVVADTGIVIEIKEEPEKTPKDANVTAQTPHPTASKERYAVENQVNNNGSGIKVAIQGKECDLDIEEVSSDEAMFDDGEPVLIEPVIESIVISSDSEPEKPEEKQVSWKERWMQKKDISSVIKASKLITNVKRKMKRDKSDKIALAQAAQVVVEENIPETAGTLSPTVIQGTVSEFNLLPPATTSLAGQPLVEQTCNEKVASEQQLPAEEHECAAQLAIEQVASEPIFSEQIPVKQLNVAEKSVDLQPEVPVDSQPVTNQSISETIQTDQCLGTSMAQKESEASKVSDISSAVLEAAVVAQNSRIGQITTEQFTRKRKKESTEIPDLHGTLEHSPAIQDMVDINALDASAVDDTLATQATDKEVITSVDKKKKSKDSNEVVKSSEVDQLSPKQDVIEEALITSVKRKKKRKDGKEIVKSCIQRVLVESPMQIETTEEQTNDVTLQAAPKTQFLSRKELKKKVRREKKKKGDKMIHKIQSVVSKGLVKGSSKFATLPVTTPIVRSKVRQSPRAKHSATNNTTVEQDAASSTEARPVMDITG